MDTNPTLCSNSRLGSSLVIKAQLVVGFHDLKIQLRKWAKGMLLDEKRKALGLKVAVRRPPHMAFLGNPGTGNISLLLNVTELYNNY